MQRIEHNEESWRFPFVMYVPRGCVNAAGKINKKLPLIVFLHGAGERGYGGEDLALVDKHGFSKIMDQIGDSVECNAIDPCLFVLPQCPEDTFWAARVESILAFIGQVAAEYDVDENRICLTGLSMGGFGTWYTAMAKPEMFAAIAPHCGGGMAWNAGVLDMPVWVVHGAEDVTVSPNQSDEMVERLKELGRDVTYRRMDGVGHAVQDYSYDLELLRWMLEKSRLSI